MHLRNITLQGDVHRFVAGILQDCDLEAKLLQRGFDQIDVIVGVFQRTDFGTVALVARAPNACPPAPVKPTTAKRNKNNPTAIHTIRLSLAPPGFRL
jgi:hypothetical protein